MKNVYAVVRLLTLSLIFFSTQTGWAQGVTTSSLVGQVTDASGEGLPGATIVAVHEPSGTRYGAATQTDGRFSIPGMRVGGPYRVEISFVGYQPEVRTGINLGLGNAVTLDITLGEDNMQLEEVVITAEGSDVFNSERTGAALNIDQERIQALPTISRDINDFTRLTPQSNGTSFAGRDNRFNNYTIDGNIYNNNFGLGSSQFAGGNPISLDAIQEVQVNLAPYDVRQGGFTGANVNAITRSGTNEFEGSAYVFFRNDQLVGDKVDDQLLSKGESRNTIYGVRLGGPILKNKLFFFVSYEQEKEQVPSFQKRALRPGETPDGITISRVPAERLDFVSQQLQSLYGYNTGAYEGYSFASEGKRFNARLDMNINENHKASVRYNIYTAFRDIPTNGNSVRFISTRYRNTDRTGIEAMNFRNTNYTNDVQVSSITGELNSRLSNKIANQLNVGYTSTTDPRRGIPGEQDFPFVEVMEPNDAGQLQYYFSIGNELYSVGNLLENKIFNITDNLTVFSGAHTMTFGVNYEYMTFDNAFNPVFNGFYRFNSYDSFVESVINRNPNVYPDAFAQSYAFDGSTTPPTDQTRFSQIGVYAQDEFQVTPNLKLTGGLRIDLPSYPMNLPRNQALDALNVTFTNPIDGSTIVPNVAEFPKVKPLFSPRVGFNWDVNGDRTTQVRGGTGIFSGRIPFVWLSNQVNGSGVIRGGVGYEGQEVIDQGILFNPDINANRPQPGEAQLSNELNITDRDFRLPQTWRSNLAVDQQLPFGITGTLEGIYSRDVSTPIAVNPVLAEPDATLNGADQRPTYSQYSNSEQFRNVFYLTNADKQGDYYSLTAQLQKQFNSGFYVSLAYTRSRSRDYGLDGGSQAISLWSAVVKENRNDPEISFTRFDQPNRFVGVLSYQKNNTTISLFYNGGEAGRFSYTYSGDFGDNAQRLIYVPRDASEINFQEFTSGDETYTPQEQADLFFNYVDQDDYLSQKRGEVVDRNGAKLPWLHRFDFRLLNDLPITKNGKHKLQVSLDILNIGNLINNSWGVTMTPIQSNILNYRGTNAEGEPVYTLALRPGTNQPLTQTFQPIYGLSQTWSAQLGLRYLFN
ncbi:Carboxypeptidase regulatory-like domain-containing protein [Catalinimonas alkaloidigena]|uniref:Carboxypeptidase regulatory-like domain-containing protein n=1 Tax=Catalinimonas alkaloidigena TaxID=1075417 RepID=A0A1G9DMF0_9BACT|nr:TonB-dependent receptor [Catalinimonas alkaloidigena]SDK65049.1 Carboxypeptidase regulatory-like domain-containing protein [Catalinimonas alkaloidigena]